MQGATASPHKCLVKVVFVIQIWRSLPAYYSLKLSTESMPGADFGFPCRRYFRDDIYPGSYVLTSFSIVSRCRAHGIRPFLASFYIFRMKLFQRGAKKSRISTYFVQRYKTIIIIKCSIFQALSHDRRTELLQLH